MNKEKIEVIRCERCNEVLDPTTAVWLELSLTDGRYYSYEIPKGHKSQGAFSFGKACAKKANDQAKPIKPKPIKPKPIKPKPIKPKPITWPEVLDKYFKDHVLYFQSSDAHKSIEGDAYLRYEKKGSAVLWIGGNSGEVCLYVGDNPYALEAIIRAILILN